VRALDLAEPAHEHDLEPGLLLDLANSGFFDALALLDSAARDDGRELWIAGKVEDEEFVGACPRVLARDVDGDRRPGSQLCCALSLAL
jgi:hypothetical protein